MAGMHLTIDGFGADNQALLTSTPELVAWMDSLPVLIGMKTLSPTICKRIAPPKCKPGWEGLSAVTLIYESHITVHTFPALGKVHADVFSCVEFDPRFVLDLFARAFGLKHWRVTVIERQIGEDD